MAEKIVLCRRDVAEIGAGVKYCARSINPRSKPNALAWCDQCRARLPLWPENENEEVVHAHREGQAALLARFA